MLRRLVHVARRTSDRLHGETRTQRTRRRELDTARPSGADPDAHEYRVELTLAREQALAALHWTGDVADPVEVTKTMEGLALRDPGVPFVRLGSSGDGGYVIPDDLEGVVACVSPGVADRADFELALLERGIPCHLLDGSVPRAPLDHPLLTFEPTFLGPRDQPGWTTLRRVIADVAPPEGDMVLQMDIEGWEWEVIPAAGSDVLSRFRIIVLELHDLHLMATRSGLRRVQEVFSALSQDFVLVNLHPNNYEFPISWHGLSMHPVVEMTWLRQDRVQSVGPGRYPHPLNAANSPDLPDFALDPRWCAGTGLKPSGAASRATSV